MVQGSGMVWAGWVQGVGSAVGLLGCIGLGTSQGLRRIVLDSCGLLECVI